LQTARSRRSPPPKTRGDLFIWLHL
jgi:hypothetical protein